MISEIQSYLQQPNPDFDSGFALFCKYSPNRILIESIGRRRDQDMLIYELDKISNSGFFAPIRPEVAAAAPAAAILSAAAKTEAPERKPVAAAPAAAGDTLEKRLNFRTYDDRRTRRSDLPPELQQEFDANAADYSVRRALHEKMKLARTDFDRAALRSRILETHQRIVARWKKIDEYQARAAEASQEECFNEKSARAYISKALKAASVTDARAAGVRARVKALLDHGCTITDATIQALRDRALL